MKEVGDLLLRTAYNNSDIVLKDKYARSAVNRFYYNNFLLLRAIAKSMGAKDVLKNHSQLPVFFRKTLMSRYRHQLYKMQKKNEITYGEYRNLVTKMEFTANRAAQILEEMYKSRKIADYEPEVTVQTSGGKYTLAGKSFIIIRKSCEDTNTVYLEIVREFSRVGIKL